MAQGYGDELGVASLDNPVAMRRAESFHVLLRITLRTGNGDFSRLPCHGIQIEHRAEGRAPAIARANVDFPEPEFAMIASLMHS